MVAAAATPLRQPPPRRIRPSRRRIWPAASPHATLRPWRRPSPVTAALAWAPPRRRRHPLSPPAPSWSSPLARPAADLRLAGSRRAGAARRWSPPGLLRPHAGLFFWLFFFSFSLFFSPLYCNVFTSSSFLSLCFFLHAAERVILPNFQSSLPIPPSNLQPPPSLRTPLPQLPHLLCTKRRRQGHGTTARRAVCS